MESHKWRCYEGVSLTEYCSNTTAAVENVSPVFSKMLHPPDFERQKHAVMATPERDLEKFHR